MINMSSEESVFGRPAKWSTALPSVLTGVLACVVALFGRFVLPAKLPERYAEHLQQSADEYGALSSASGMFGSSKLLAAAGQRDVIFERLVSLERGSPERYWEWTEFLIEHAELLRERLDDPASSIQNDSRERFVEQANAFDAKATDILEQLAVGDSQLRGVAVLKLSTRQYEAAMLKFGMLDATAMTERLRPVATTQVSPLSELQVAEAQLLLVTLTVEAAWQQTTGSQLNYAPEFIQQAERWLNEFKQQGADRTRPLEWAALARIIQIYNGNAAREAGNEAVRASRDTEWRSRLAELQLAACDAQWGDVEYLLPVPTDKQSAPIGFALVRTLCRILCSEAARRDQEWASEQTQAIRLVGPWVAQLPEWSELLWESARVLASDGDAAEQVDVVPMHVAQQLMASGEPLLVATLVALKGTIAVDDQLVDSGVSQLTATPGGMFLVSRVVLWRAQTASTVELEGLAGSLRKLQQRVVTVEPTNSLGWFALGVLEFRLANFEDAEQAFSKANELAPEALAIRDALNAVKAARNANRIPVN